MKPTALILVLVACMMMSLLAFAPAAQAEEKMVGVVTKIEMSDKSAIVSLKDNKTEKVVDVVVTDQETLDKLKDHRIVVGDEIRCRYETEGGKNSSKGFRKTAGC